MFGRFAKGLLAVAILLAAGLRAAHAGPVLLYDTEGDRVLYAEAADQPWYAASLTKMMTAYLVSENLVQNIDYERIAALLDPFAIRTFALATKYWTVAEKNTTSAGLTGLLLWNRLLWLAVGALIFLFACYKFDFTERRASQRKRVPEPLDEASASPHSAAIPAVMPAVTFHDAPWLKFAASTKIHLLGIVKSTGFIVILLAASRPRTSPTR